MDFPIIARFTDRRTGNRVAGQIAPADELDLLGWTRWHYRRADGDQDWDWRNIFLECAASGGRRECFSARVGAELHGLMVLDLKGRRFGSHPWLVVDYLATNPGNRAANRGLKHLGAALMAVAIARSMERGLAGRLWLESLEGAQRFYDNLGMDKSSRRSEEGHRIYTLETESAAELLEEIKRQRIIET